MTKTNYDGEYPNNEVEEFQGLEATIKKREARIKKLDVRLIDMDIDLRMVNEQCAELTTQLAQAKAEAYKEIIAKVKAIDNPYVSKGLRTGKSYSGTDYGSYEICRQDVLSQLKSGLPLEGKG